MLKFMSCLLIVALCVITAGCTKPVEAPEAGQAVPSLPAKAGTAEQLVGSDWIIGDMVVSFKDTQTLSVKGGAVEEMAPNGVEGTYSIKNGAVEVLVEIMGEQHVRRGTWDGERLIVDGTPALRQ
jgi:hypothetical protein